MNLLHVPTDQRAVSRVARGAYPVPDVGRENLGDVLPDIAPAVEKKDQREHHQQCRGDDFGDGGRSRQCAAGQLRLIVLQRLDRRVAGVLDLLAAQVKRPLDQPIASGIDAAGDLLDQIRQTVDELADDECQDAAQNRKRA